jgi:gluconate 5-dehydrogenase
VQELFDLHGRVAFVTGGGSGLGLQMTRGLAEAGASVALASRRGTLCRDEARIIQDELDVETLGLTMDVTREEDVEDAISETISKFGHLDILVNNSGIFMNKPTTDVKRDEWNYVMDVNMTGAFYCCRAAGRHMIPRRYGKIINVASIYGTSGIDGRFYVRPGKEPVEGTSFNASKGALVNFTRGLATAWARHNINVNCISPGGFITEGVEQHHKDRMQALISEWNRRTPLGRMGDEDDLKGAAVYLASEASKYVTGQNLVVDGGWTIW